MKLLPVFAVLVTLGTLCFVMGQPKEPTVTVLQAGKGVDIIGSNIIFETTGNQVVEKAGSGYSIKDK